MDWQMGVVMGAGGVVETSLKMAFWEYAFLASVICSELER